MGSQFIVGCTDTPGGEDALALGLALADSAPAGDASITVASFWPLDTSAYAARARNEGYEQALAADAGSRLQGARDRCADRDDVVFVVRGATSPAHGLHLLADELGADAIVVGRSHTGPVGRAFTGSATEQTLHGAACPVAVAPPGYASESHGIDTIAVAFDGSPESEHALTHAIRLARDRHAALRLVRVIEPMPIAYGEFVDPYPFAIRHADVEELLQTAAARIVGVPVTTSVLDGDAVRALAGPGAGADLLVLGSRDFGPLDRILLGATGARLSRHCRSPLLVLPRSVPDAGATSDHAGVGAAAGPELVS